MNFDFETHTGAYAGCSAVLNGGLLLFGGHPEQHQVYHLTLIINSILRSSRTHLGEQSCWMLAQESRNTTIQFLLRIMQYFCISRRKSFVMFRLESLPILPYVSQIDHSNFCKLFDLLSFDGENYETVASTRYSHVQTFGMAKYQGRPLTTGAYHERSVKTEIMNLSTGGWEAGPDYPFQEL